MFETMFDTMFHPGLMFKKKQVPTDEEIQKELKEAENMYLKLYPLFPENGKKHFKYYFLNHFESFCRMVESNETFNKEAYQKTKLHFALYIKDRIKNGFYWEEQEYGYMFKYHCKVYNYFLV